MKEYLYRTSYRKIVRFENKVNVKQELNLKQFCLKKPSVKCELLIISEHHKMLTYTHRHTKHIKEKNYIMKWHVITKMFSVNRCNFCMLYRYVLLYQIIQHFISPSIFLFILGFSSHFLFSSFCIFTVYCLAERKMNEWFCMSCTCSNAFSTINVSNIKVWQNANSWLT